MIVVVDFVALQYCFMLLSGSKKIFLHKLSEVLKETRKEDKSCTWQLKVICFFSFLVEASCGLCTHAVLAHCAVKT